MVIDQEITGFQDMGMLGLGFAYWTGLQEWEDCLNHRIPSYGDVGFRVCLLDPACKNGIPSYGDVGSRVYKKP
jgi:hypothetical protein